MNTNYTITRLNKGIQKEKKTDSNELKKKYFLRKEKPGNGTQKLFSTVECCVATTGMSRPLLFYDRATDRADSREGKGWAHRSGVCGLVCVTFTLCARKAREEEIQDGASNNKSKAAGERSKASLGMG